MLWLLKGCGNLRDVVMLWVFKGCDYGVFKGCGYVMGI